MALLPAIVTTILIFMDQQITAVIVNKKEFKLKVLHLVKNIKNYNQSFSIEIVWISS